MAVSKTRCRWLLPFIVAVMASGMVFTAFAAEGDQFADIWKEGPEGPPRQRELSPERLDQVVKYVAKDDSKRQKELNDLYKNDRDKFWSEVRDFFRKQRSDGGGGSIWREAVQRQHDEFLAWLKLPDNFPDIEKRLSLLRADEKKADEYSKQFSKAREKYWHIFETDKRNEELAGVLKEEVRLTDYRDKIIRDIHRAHKSSHRKKLIAELREVVSKRFDLIIRKKQLQFEELRRRLERLRKELEEREKEMDALLKNKEAAVESRLKKLMPHGEK